MHMVMKTETGDVISSLTIEHAGVNPPVPRKGECVRTGKGIFRVIEVVYVCRTGQRYYEGKGYDVCVIVKEEGLDGHRALLALLWEV